MSRKTAVLRDAIALATALNAITALAQTPVGGDDARTLDAITVTGSRISIPGDDPFCWIGIQLRARWRLHHQYAWPG